MKKSKILVICIVLLGFCLRFYNIQNLPALNADEASIGYNAYSLLLTGKDEHGNTTPLHFQSFNDYKPGLYFYLALPFVRLLGLNEIAVRLPNVIFGTTTILVVYFLVFELAKNKKLASIASLMLAISPWHIHFSRGGWETNTATFFITLGVFFFLKGFYNHKYVLLSGLSFIFSMYTYHALRIVVPVLLGGLFILHYKKIIQGFQTNFPKNIFVATSLLCLILTTPLIISFRGVAGVSRASGVGLLADPGPYLKVNQQRGEHYNTQLITSRIFHNKFANYSLSFVQNYLKHFDGNFLFITGDEIQRNKVPEFGQMYLFDLLLVGIGLIIMLKNLRTWCIVALWLMTAPLASAATFQSPHAVRAENMVIPLIIISSIGGCYMLTLLKRLNMKQIPHFSKIILCSFAVFVVWNFFFYIHEYYFHMSKTYNFSSQYGVKELVEYTKTSIYENIVVTDRYDQPYILFLFYLQYPPGKFQHEHELTPKDKYGFSTVNSFGKYTFIDIDSWDNIREKFPNSLIAGTSEEIPPGANVVKTIHFPNGDVAFKVVAN